ncbi:MAG: hypothetical protein EOP32_11385 [Rhodococcus sp. (in: high G+C Gram-positive bacteria)]|nr:MAG: hypothetical protein EOP32_11385 [Rhodococcus sp. (in: high G+C Gram-positive bacteria)]
MSAAEEGRQISQVAARLLNRFPSASREAVGTVVGEAVAHFAGCPIRDFVPSLVERAVTAEFGSLVEA